MSLALTLRLCKHLSRPRGIPSSAAKSVIRAARVPSRACYATQRELIDYLPDPPPLQVEPIVDEDPSRPTHAVVSCFDLFSIGIGPSSSHSVGPMRAGKIFVTSLKDLGLLHRVSRIRIALYGSLAATGKGHLTPQALLAGLEGEAPDTIDPAILMPRFETINRERSLVLGGERRIDFQIDRDMIWHWDQQLDRHPNGLALIVFDESGDMLSSNRYYSIGGGFVISDQTKMGENVYYKETRSEEAATSRRRTGKDAGTLALPAEAQSEADSNNRLPPFPFWSSDSLLAMSRQHNLTIAQIAYENELAYRSADEVRAKMLELWDVMNECIRQGVTSLEETLPGPLKVKRRAPALHKRLLRGLFPGESVRSAIPEATLAPPQVSKSDSVGSSYIGKPKMGIPPVTAMRGRIDHPLPPISPRRTIFPALDMLSCYAIATNEVNAAGGRVVTAPTNGASGVLPAVLKYVVEFISDNPERDILTYLLTASAIGSLFKRGATISAAEGGCMAEVGVATAMAAAGFTAVMGGSPEACERAAEIGIERALSSSVSSSGRSQADSLGLTCDPLAGQVQVPCIERNALGAVKAVTAAQLALASDNDSHLVTLDMAIAAMKQTADNMSVHYKETSRAGLAVAVKGRAPRVPVSVPEC